MNVETARSQAVVSSIKAIEDMLPSNVIESLTLDTEDFDGVRYRATWKSKNTENCVYLTIKNVESSKSPVLLRVS